MTQIVPAILVKNKEAFETQLRAVENDCQRIQVDILDNSLFPNETWHDAETVGSLNPNVEIELHLMVENPLPIIEAWKEHVPSFIRAIVHAEMHRQLGSVTSYIKDVLKLEVGVAVNPETPLSAIENVIHDIDQLTIMSVHPGFQGQTFGDEEHMGDKEAIFEKIRRAKQHRPDLPLEIDGGLTEELIKPLIDAGITLLGAGSIISKHPNPAQQLKHLNELVKTYEA
jgi:ribulose-phosphate 3-epimerase